MNTPIFQVDAFADRPFAGNPAAVCLLDAPRDEAWMAHVAAEMNLAETAFLFRRHDGWDLRWFTPLVEVDLCGHATLASAHTLWEQGCLPRDEPARFHTRSGLLTATRRDDWIELDFPAIAQEPVETPPGLVAALGATPLYTGRSHHNYLVELDGEEAVHALAPDLARLKSLPVQGVIATGRASGQDYDVVSRYFAPAVGIDEDPVTGSAHCVLGPFWSARLGTDRFVGYQASARGGIVRVRNGGARVYLQGQAVTVLRGELV